MRKPPKSFCSVISGSRSYSDVLDGSEGMGFRVTDSKSESLSGGASSSLAESRNVFVDSSSNTLSDSSRNPGYFSIPSKKGPKLTSLGIL